ncbi:RHS repeat-associated protein [Bosea sp. BE125]|uniref:RHS repeat-associated core domain-containing protein n=1 Tax=Bosea sp. BE125 TaxID=2817909 RepID=UPI0028660BB8|nr:RHS repeat-associated core domain-containing protein [Bosea sp. BE125]MDR6872188.1 RHS repeat-associated protein [Bosea sp. BE125]
MFKASSNKSLFNRALVGAVFGIILASFSPLFFPNAHAQVVAQGQRVSIAEANEILDQSVAGASAAGFAPAGSARTVGPQAAVGASAFAAASAPVTSSCLGSLPQPLEIATLAAALKCDPDLIFEYVYNNIEYEPLFGSNKGALGTLLGGLGNDWDQAKLLIALLNAAGVTQTNFQYGYIRLTGANTPGWLGVKNDVVAIANLFDNGGVPLGSVFANPDGTLNQIDVAHVWVKVSINGINYVFDPSFKQNTIINGISNLASSLGYNKSQFAASAGGSVDSVSIANINRSSIRSNLVNFANNLINYVKSTNPAATTNDVIGGKMIIPLTGSPIRQTTLPYLSPSQPIGVQTWATIPNAYRTCFTISMPGVTPSTCSAPSAQSVLLYADETFGQRITVFSQPDPATPNRYIPKLLIDGSAPSSGTSIGPSTAFGDAWNVNTAIKHPYTGSLATIFNQSANLAIRAGGSYLIGAGWGRVGRGMVDKHRRLLAQALAVPGAHPASEAVLGESLAVVSYNWLAENAAQQSIGDRLGQLTSQYHHGVGITAQSQIQTDTGVQGPYVDLPLNGYSVTSQACWPQLQCPFFVPQIFSWVYSISGASSILESGVLEQTQAPTPNMVAASTVKIVDMNAATSARIFFADGTTSAGLQAYFSSIRPNLTSYRDADLAAIDWSISTNGLASGSPAGNQVLIPTNGNTAVGVWHGAGFTIITQTSTSLNIIQRISGGLSGGFSGTGVSIPDQVSNTFDTIPTLPSMIGVPAFFNPQPWVDSPKVSDPIDLATGANVYSHSDLSVGSGSFPYALSFARTYRSSANKRDVGLGNGWTHSFSYSAGFNSDPYAGLGAGSAIDAASAIAAIYVSQDLLKNSAQSAQSLTLAWMVNRWLSDQLTNNSVVVSQPETSEAFIALPRSDGAMSISYSAPFGSAATLTGTALNSGIPNTYNYIAKDGVTLGFGAPPAGKTASNIATWRHPNGMGIDFTYDASGNLLTVANNLGRQISLSYAGSHISAVSDGQRSVTFGYSGDNLVSATDPLGSITTYAYDADSQLTQVFYPSNPSIPYVSNDYDGLGHVIRQANANGNVSQFYFAGSRSEIVDPAGGRRITYQTPRGKIVRDATVLSGSFGTVFGDTGQQNGAVNITTNQYDGQDRLVLTTAPEGGATAYAYSLDLKHNVIATTRTAKPGSPLSPLTTTFQYDTPFNQPTRVTDPRGLVTALSYDPVTSNLLSVVRDADALGFKATTRMSYNAYGQPLSSVDPVGTTTQYVYDERGNAVQIVRDAGGAGALNQTTRSAYNSLGDVTSTTDPNGNVAGNSYDANRRLVRSVAPPTGAAFGSIVTELNYDPDGRVLRTQQSANGVSLRSTSATYTPSGQTATSTDANGNIARYAYDVADRPASIRDALGRVTQYGYDLAGRRISVSNLAVQSNPLLQQDYTPDGLPASLTIARGNSQTNVTSYIYDGFDRLSVATYPNASTETFTYDNDNNVLTRKTRANQTISFAYDTLNRQTSKASSGQPTVSYAYDLAGRVISVSDTGASLVNALPPSGGTASFATSLSYDALNRPLAVSWNPAPAPAVAPAASSVAFSYSYNQVNQRIGQTASDASWWLSPAAASTTAYAANNLDQYTAVGAVTPSYDGNGNLTSDGSFTYAYDPENRLTGVMQGATTVASYDFDAQGRRKQKTVGAAKTVFVTDADNREVLEYDGTSGQVLRWYAYGLGSNEALNQIEVSPATRTSFIPDIQGSVQATLASATGTLAKTGYLPFGQSAASTGTFRYTGQRIDTETGLYYYRARMYAPALGRFLQPDPIGTQGGLNLYAYVGNDPLNLIDPTGWVQEAAGSFGQRLLSSFVNAVPGAYYGGRVPEEFRAGNYGNAAIYGAMALGDAALGIATFGASTEVQAGVRSVSSIATATAREIGVAGETAVRSAYDIGPKIAIPINGLVRFPDGLTGQVVSEVKNVANLSFTRQLRDYSDFAQSTGRSFDLYMRGTTNISGPLARAIESGKINPLVIPPY